MNDRAPLLQSRLRFVLGVGALTFVFLLLFRLAFGVMFWRDGGESDFSAVLQAAYLGAKFDLRLTSILCLPLLLLSCVPALDPLRSRLAKRGWMTYFLAAWSGITLVYIVDFAHYAYLESRVDASVIEHLAAPEIALEMVWESYPVAGLLVSLTAIVLIYVLFVRHVTNRFSERGGPQRSALGRLATTVVVFLALGAALYGKISYYPLRWSEAYSAQSPYAVALGLNPVLQLADTWKHRHRRFDLQKVREHYDEVSAYLGVDEPHAKELDYRRHVPARPVQADSPNIVIVICESLAAFKVGCMGNELDPTPRFDALAEEGWLFSRFFVPSGPTARSVFSAVTSVPDVNPSDSASRNPLMVQQRPVINEFEGYEKHYFLGGSASWGNIRGMLQHNLPGLRLHEEGDYDAPRADVWGVSDLDLVREANSVLRESESPFFAIIQTSGNHSPWTIPEEHGDFELVSGIEDQALRDAGFPELIDHYNAVRFLDYAMGELVALSKNEAYFENTIFMFFGDHGTAFPAKNSALPGLTLHHVPFLVYAPSILRGSRRFDLVCSSLDVVPTAAGLAGLAYENDTMGRDLFDDSRPRSPYAYLNIRERPGLVGPEFFLQTLPDGSRQLFRYTSEEPLADVQLQFPDELEQMASLADGLFETAFYMLYRDNVARESLSRP